MLPRRFLLFIIPLSLAIWMAPGQDEATFKSDVRVVSVLASVRDKKGAFVRDLSKDDFSLIEDGRPQTITYFARETNLPLTLGLMVDTSMSQHRLLDAERGASYRFLDRMLRDQDQVFIMQFDMAVQLSQDLTSSRKQLEDTLPLVDTPTREELNMEGTRGGTLLYDAVVKAANDIMKKRTGRKALIVLSDGGENGSDATLEEAIDAAQLADTLIYSILFADPAYQGFGGPDGASILKRLAKETGGGFYEVSKKQSIDQIFDRIQDELRSQYSLGYVPDKPVTVSEFRRIKLTTNQTGLVVQARDRYWAKR
jgi:VWFA-related protein